MRTLVARLALAAVLFMGFAGLSAGQQRASRPFDSMITQRPVMPFNEFEQALQAAASQTGVSPDIVERIVQEFAQTYNLRVTPYVEWRSFLLDSLYRDAVPYSAAKEFLHSLRSSAGLTVDTGFLEAVRTVDLGNRAIYQVDKEKGLTPPKAIAQPLPSYTEAARSAGVEGIVLLKCVVLEDGTVANCQLLRTAGWGMDESAFLAVQDKWRFEPARLNGKPVAVQANIEVTMRLY